MAPALIIFGGLPGTGKTTLARALAGQLAALYLRIDSIEQALRGSAAFAGELLDAGYRVAYAVARDNLTLGAHGGGGLSSTLSRSPARPTARRPRTRRPAPSRSR